MVTVTTVDTKVGAPYLVERGHPNGLIRVSRRVGVGKNAVHMPFSTDAALAVADALVDAVEGA